MVKGGSGVGSLKKPELVEILQSNGSSMKQRNKAAKLLKQFEPNPRTDFDNENNPSKLKLKQYEMVQHFL
jgi:hypothetical protein